MEITVKPTNNKYLNTGIYRSEKVTGYKNLGTIISNDNNLGTEIHHRLMMANRRKYDIKKQNHITSIEELNVNFIKP
jgi:hypothetical protein